MSYANRKEMGSNRTAGIVVVALIHVALGYALVTGLAYNVIKKTAEDLKTFDVSEPPPPPEKPPPPPPKDNTPPPPQVVAPPPMVRINNVSPPPVFTTPVYTPQPPAVITAPPPPQPPPAPRVSQSARAKGNLISLFTTDDYPASSLRNEEQGSATARMTIGTDGRVSDCQIVASSGFPALDAATCNILRRRAKFTPAKDNAGNPITDTFSQRIKWVVPAE